MLDEIQGQEKAGMITAVNLVEKARPNTRVAYTRFRKTFDLQAKNAPSTMKNVTGTSRIATLLNIIQKGSNAKNKPDAKLAVVFPVNSRHKR